VSKPLNVSVNIVKPSVVVLPAHPTPAQLAAARNAFRAGHIVEMLDGTADDLNALLGLGAGTVQGDEQPPGTSTHSQARLKVIGVHATPNGSVRQFHGLASGSAATGGRPQKDTVWQTPLKAWIAREQQRAGAPGDGLPQPSADAWTQLQELTFQQSDAQGNILQNTISVYRLNDIDTTHDWYMVLQDPTSEPNFSTTGSTQCSFVNPTCGWWTGSRNFTIQTNPSFVLFDHGPTQQITTSTGGFTIGAGLEGAAPDVGVSYTTT
jgi:hypothetical protein